MMARPISLEKLLDQIMGDSTDIGMEVDAGVSDDSDDSDFDDAELSDDGDADTSIFVNNENDNNRY